MKKLGLSVVMFLLIFSNAVFAANGAFQIYNGAVSFPDGSVLLTAPKDGKSILNGSGAPNIVTQIGDFYIDTTNNRLYGPYNGSWGTGVSLIGSQGPKGDTGAACQLTLASICSAISVGGTQSPSFCPGTTYFPLTIGSQWTYSDLRDQSIVTDIIQPDGRMQEVISNSQIPANNGTTYYTWLSNNSGFYLTKMEEITFGYTRLYSLPIIQWPSNLTSGAITTNNYAYTSTGSSGSGTKTITVLGTESVTVPAGTFNAIKIKLENTNASSGVTSTSYAWWAAYVGSIQRADGTGTVYSQLTSYSIK